MSIELSFNIARPVDVIANGTATTTSGIVIGEW